MKQGSRKQAIIAICFVWLLVCGGLGWATRSAVHLDAIENRAAWEHTNDEAIKLELARLDNLISEIIVRERARPYEHFRAFYKPAKPLDAPYGAEYAAPIFLPSPLRDASGPNWMLLHFQASETEGWSSPQLQEGDELATPAGAIPAPQRAQYASPENWLAALKERYTPASLQQILEHALVSPFTELTGAGTSPETHSAISSEPVASNQPSPAESKDDAFVRRGQLLLEIERANFPGEQCEPELVALENLQAGGPSASNINRTGQNTNECVPVRTTRMMPLWLDLTGDGNTQLALVRSVSVETSRYCTLQGVLIDWDRLRAALEAEARIRFPRARILPIRGLSHQTSGMLRAIPARLITGEEPPIAIGGISKALRGGLGLAWGMTLLAMMAITYGTMKYVTMTERRLRFVAAVTHELRTPLTSFQLYTDLLADMPTENAEKRRKFADVLRAEAARLSRLVENVLSYSRVGVNAPTLKVEDVSPAALLESAVAATSDKCAAAKKKLVIENACPANATIQTDPQFVAQILANLVENACKYSVGADDDRIWLSASPGPGGTINFEVDDAGPGVSPSQRRAVFEPFRRGVTRRDRQASGIGLGLSLSRYWAECLGGELQLKRSSRNGTHYSCFLLKLPTRAA